MGNLDFSANADQLKELAAYMASQINVPTIGIGGGYAPIGTIISVMGTTAPQDYLACDGTVYNIADYPQLADYFESQFGESNHFGGNGTTTFAVPDLQGEFLRGAGTNSHENQGSGDSVGTHQDATEHILLSGGDPYIATCKFGADMATAQVNTDSLGETTATTKYANTTAGTGQYNRTYTSRPTNTSVLYCIKAVVAGEVYSTEERVVGTWIDGKPLYQISYKLLSNVSIIKDTWVTIISSTSLSIISDIDVLEEVKIRGNKIVIPHAIKKENNDIQIYIEGVGETLFANDIITIQYTKTTDA